MLRTVKLPIEPDRPEDLRIALDQGTAVARLASILLPGHGTPEKPVHRMSGTDSRVAKVYKYIRKTGICDLLGAQTVQTMVSTVALKDLKSASSNWQSRMRRTRLSSLVSQYQLWGWVGKLAGFGAGDDWGMTPLELVSCCIEVLGKSSMAYGLVDAICSGRKPLNRHNRPVYRVLLPLSLHNQSLEVDGNHIIARVGPQNMGGRFKLRVLPSKPRRHGGEIARIGNPDHYQESWLELVRNGSLKLKGSSIMYKSGRWWFNAVLENSVEEAKIDSVAYVGIHGGIYRPLTWTVFDDDGRFVHQRVISGKTMIRLWSHSEEIAIRQRQYRAKEDWQECLGCGRSGPCLMSAWAPWKRNRSRTKTIDGLTYHRYRLSMADVSRKEKRLRIGEVTRARYILDTIRIAIRQMSDYFAANCTTKFVVFYHDWTFIRDHSMRLKHMWGPQRSSLPSSVRSMGARWPFAKINDTIEHNLDSLPNVELFAINPSRACTSCSICSGAHGRHMDVDHNGVEWAHWHSNFQCDDCGRTLNADINASRFAGLLALAWDRADRPSKRDNPDFNFLREVEVPPPPSSRSRKLILISEEAYESSENPQTNNTARSAAVKSPLNPING